MKKKLLNSLRVLLVAVGLIVGANFAWGDKTYTTVFTQNYSSSDYASGWTSTNSDRTGFAQFTRTDLDGSDKSALLVYHVGSNNGATATYSSLNSVSAYNNSTDWCVEFDVAFHGCDATTSNSNASLVVNTSLGGNITFTMVGTHSGNSNNPSYGTTVTYKDGETTTTLCKLYQDAQDANLSSENILSTFSLTRAKVYHVIITGEESEGININITGDMKDANNNSASSASAQISSSLGYVSTIAFNTARSQGQIVMLDNLTAGVNIEPYKTRATATTTVYTSIKDNVMNPTVKNALETANTNLAAYATDEAIVANVEDFVSKIAALETANANAQTSINQFIVLNDLIKNADDITGYVAPTGAESVFTSNPASDVDTEALEASVRAAIITAGTANENTNITALIANSSFELGNTLGWTTVASDDTGARAVGTSGSTYYTTEADGSYLFNTWSKGTPITQTIGTLPAGQYTVACKVASNGATMYLTMNDSHSTGTSTSDSGTFIDAEYTFTLGSATEVTIGLVGGAGDGSYTAEGHWWYKADKFTLTYNGEDPLEQAKTALNDEIDAATTIKDTWTPKVGTAPFKYDATYYNALVSAIDAAQAVIDADGDDVDEYTDALDALQDAEDDMASSTQNTPDPTKYYRIFVANNDGTASDYNLNMLKETTKTQVTVTAAPYPVKFATISGSSRYNIQTYNGNSLCTDYTAVTTAYTNGWDGSSARCGNISVILNDNGSVTLAGYRGGGIADQNYTASASEGSGVTATAGASGKWVVSDAVDVSDVTLSVNAAAGWGTFIAPYDNLIPSTVKAYTVSYTENNVVYFTENETGVLSANTPYILSTEEAEDVSTTFKGIANNTEDTYTVNGLVGLLTASTVPADSYVLQYNDGKVGFYKTTSDITGTANRCYLDLASVPTSASSRASVGFGIYDGEATSISTTLNERGEMTNDKFIYNLNGQRVNHPMNGLFIVNGKKVVIR